MQQVAESGGNAVVPKVFARNRLVIAVAAGNPRGVTGLASLASPAVTVALCVEQVPCGRAAKQALAAGGVRIVPVTLERDVKAVLAKLKLGEVDAGLVYHSDVRFSPDVVGIEFSESVGAINEYPISVLGKAPNPGAAAAFVDHVLSGAGRAVLADAGFEVP
jgi:molybdate transport system substrate-binding protein